MLHTETYESYSSYEINVFNNDKIWLNDVAKENAPP